MKILLETFVFKNYTIQQKMPNIKQCKNIVFLPKIRNTQQKYDISSKTKQSMMVNVFQ